MRVYRNSFIVYYRVIYRRRRHPIWKRKKDEITIRSSAAEYLTYVASVGDQQDSIDMRYADENIPDTPEEWLDGFNIFSIYQVLPQLIEIWGLKVQTDVSAKKTSSNRSPDDNTFIFTSLRTTGGLVSEIWICLPLASWMICMLKRAVTITKNIKKWRFRRTSTNFNQLVDFGAWTICKILILYCFCPYK